MAEIILGKFLVDLIKLLAKEIQSWKASRKNERQKTVDYIANIADKLDNFAAGLSATPQAPKDAKDFRGNCEAACHSEQSPGEGEALPLKPRAKIGDEVCLVFCFIRGL